MEFCSVCCNKLYLREKENKLFLYCKKCNFEKKNTKIVISKKTYAFVEQEPDTINNEYITFDNTLPYTMTKQCPNKECGKKDAVFYPDEKTREITYVCCYCFSKWKLT